MRLLLSTSASVLLAYGALGCGCSEQDGAVRQPTDGGSAADADASSDGGGDASPNDAGLTWTRAAWVEGCVFETASDATLAMPTIAWKACQGDVAGCEIVDVTWEHAPGPAMVASVSTRAGEPVFGVYIKVSTATHEERAGVYGSDGTPIAAWRGFGCTLTGAEVTPNTVWYGAQPGTASRSFYTAEPYHSLGTTQAALPLTVPSQSRRANDDLFGIEATGASRLVVYDRNAAVSHELAGPGVTVSVPGLTPDAAFFVNYVTDSHPEGWVMVRSSSEFKPIVAVLDQAVPDIQSDGETIVWIQTPIPEPAQPWPAGDLWTSPHVTAQSALVPTKRRGIVNFSSPHRALVGAGFYAYRDRVSAKIHLYRLSDARHWELGVPPPGDSHAGGHIDGTFIYYNTDAGLVRQRLNALGLGD